MQFTNQTAPQVERRQMESKKAFPEDSQKALSKIFREGLGKDKDKALLSAVDYVETTFEKNGVKASRAAVPFARPTKRSHR